MPALKWGGAWGRGSESRGPCNRRHRLPRSPPAGRDTPFGRCLPFKARTRAAYAGLSMACMQGGRNSVVRRRRARNMSGEAASRAELGLSRRAARFRRSRVRPREGARERGSLSFSSRGGPLVISVAVREKADAVARSLVSRQRGGQCDRRCGHRACCRRAARTPITWPRAVGQIPIFFGQRPQRQGPSTRRTISRVSISTCRMSRCSTSAHGLTYGRFVLSNLRITPERVTESDIIEVRVAVTNEGARGRRKRRCSFLPHGQKWRA